jgi:GxxExxY protein
MSANLIYPEESYRIIGACFSVYNEMGSAFTEPVYQECLELEFSDLTIPFASQPELPLTYRGRRLKTKFRPDFICFGRIVLEIKAVSALTPEHESQVLNYLHATELKLGLLVNFGSHPRLEYKRVALTRRRPQPNDPIIT